MTILPRETYNHRWDESGESEKASEIFNKTNASWMYIQTCSKYNEYYYSISILTSLSWVSLFLLLFSHLLLYITFSSFHQSALASPGRICYKSHRASCKNSPSCPWEACTLSCTGRHVYTSACSKSLAFQCTLWIHLSRYRTRRLSPSCTPRTVLTIFYGVQRALFLLLFSHLLLEMLLLPPSLRRKKRTRRRRRKRREREQF